MKNAEPCWNPPELTRHDERYAPETRVREPEHGTKCTWGETERTDEKPDWYRMLFHA